MTNAPVRTCVGCRARAPKPDLLRLVRTPTAVEVDARQRAAGRGAYLHPDVACLDLAVKRRVLGRALRTTAVEPGSLAAAVRAHLAGTGSSA